MIPGMRNLITDVPGLLVGHATDPVAMTGTTVLTAERPFTAGVHIMGGAPGTRDTPLLEPDKTVPQVDALVLSGGSGYGVDAGGGVMRALAEAGRGFAVGPVRVPIAPTAILFDLLIGDKDPIPDYAALGRRAYEAIGETFPLGSVGAGTGATTATGKGGLGSASIRFGEVTVGALVAVNALGSATHPGGCYFAAPWEIDGEFGGLGVPGAVPPDYLPLKTGPSQNTTIAIVATNAALDKAGCTRLAISAHDGMARALVPSHTPLDGDLVFAASTGAVPVSDATAMKTLCHAAATTLARAIARGVHAAAGQSSVAGS